MTKLITNNIIDTERIDFMYSKLHNTIEQLLTTDLTSILISGQPGIGKSYTVKDTLSKIITPEGFHLLENIDYVFVTGQATAKGLYNLLYQYKDDTILIFDDCDNVLKDETAINILKSALDLSPERYICWLKSKCTTSIIEDDAPDHFNFTSKVIFITNLPVKKIDTALLNRTIFFNISLTPEEFIYRAKTIKHKLMPNLNDSQIDIIFSTILTNINTIHSLSFRTFLKLNYIYSNNNITEQDILRSIKYGIC